MTRLPVLRVLVLNNANIAQEAAYWLAQGSWPLLTDLDLSYNQLNAKDMSQVANGFWPNLQCLSVTGNPFGYDGLQHLTKGDWPVLTTLHIGLKMPERDDSISLLGLDPDRVQELESPAGGCLHKNVRQVGADLWPTLKRDWTS